ncbi:PaaI family thioesterase [Thermodesulfobacteriota bacterium]
MDDNNHYRALEKMYLAAPINEIFKTTILVSNESAEIGIEVNRKLFHAGGAVHGSIYFKILDDAAFFAANSIVTDYFLLTKSFTIYLTRPISSGYMKSVGKIVNKAKKQIITESFVYNDQGVQIGSGNGIFVKSKLSMDNFLLYNGV